MNNSNEIAATYKILLIGNTNVGKSSVLLRFADNEFLSDNELGTTIGVDFKVKLFKVNSKMYKLNIWDTAGQERFRTLTSSYYRNTNGCIIMYDVTNRSTFENLDTWFSELSKYNNNNISVMLVGNKQDEIEGNSSNREVSHEEAQTYAQSKKAMFIECSAKQNINIVQMMEILVEKV